MVNSEGARLDEFDKDEWHEVARKLRPDWTDDDFNREWNEFQQLKHKRSIQ